MKVAFEEDTLTVLDVPMPISVNKAYVTVRGRRILSKEGKIYKSTVTTGVAKQLSLCTQYTDLVNEETPLKLEITLYLERTENKGYPKKTKTRYKRVDVSNRVKLLEDALFDALGVDDSSVFSLTITKQDRPTDRDTDYCNLTLSRWPDGGVQAT